MPRIEVRFTDDPPRPLPATCAAVDVFGALKIIHNGNLVGQYYPAPNLRDGDMLDFYYHLPMDGH